LKKPSKRGGSKERLAQWALTFFKEGKMKNFSKVLYGKKKNISIIILSLVFISVFFILFKNLNTPIRLTSYENDPVDIAGEETDDLKEEFHPIIIKPQTPGLAYDDEIGEKISRSDLLYRYKPVYMYRGWNDDPEIQSPNKFVDEYPQDLPRAFKDMNNLYGSFDHNTQE
jgi:hypothetical protein